MKMTIKKYLSFALAALMLVSVMATAAFAEDGAETEAEAAIKAGDVVAINYGAHDYADNELNRVFYAYDFDVAAVDGDKATLTRTFVVKDTLAELGVNMEKYTPAIDAIGFTELTLTVDVNVEDLTVYDGKTGVLPYAGDVSEELAAGDVVTVKYDSTKADGTEIKKFMSLLDFEVKEINEGVATLEGGIKIAEAALAFMPYVSDEFIAEHKDTLMNVLTEMDKTLSEKTYTLDVKVEDLASLEVAEEEEDSEEDTNSEEPTTESDTNTEEDILWGDADKSGVVDMMDVVTMQKHIAEFDIEIDEIAADVSLNGDVTMMDVATLQRFIAKLIDKLPLIEEISDVDTASEDTATEDTASEDTATEDTASEDTATEDTNSEEPVGTDWRTNQPYVTAKLTIGDKEVDVLAYFEVPVDAEDGKETVSNIIFYYDKEEQEEIGKIELATPIAAENIQSARENMTVENNVVTIPVGEDKLVFNFDGTSAFTAVTAQ